MKRLLKKVIKPLVPMRLRAVRELIVRDYSFHRSGRGMVRRVMDVFRYACTRCLVYPERELEPNRAAARQFAIIARRIRFTHMITEPYFYPLDTKVIRIIPAGTQAVVSLTQDYAKVLTMDLWAVRRKMQEATDDFSCSMVLTIDAIDCIRRRALGWYGVHDRRIRVYLDRIMDTVPESLDEALQKILFFNALMWMNRQRHIGLGRLDVILEPYYRADVEAGRLNRERAKEMIRQFVSILGTHTAFKSEGMIGDTGQVILLSGIDRGGDYVENDLTHLFLEVVAELNVPDPKLILRVSEQTSDGIWAKAIACLSRGNGSPLLANDPKIRGLMEQFGYEAADTVDFGTSACWEPLIIGKSFDQNNCTDSINLPLIVARIMDESQEYGSYEAFEAAFFDALGGEIDRIAVKSEHIEFDRAPLQSLWMEDCLVNRADVACGGAKYNYHGFLTTGLPNAVNSLLNVSTEVFGSGVTISYGELCRALRKNYVGYESLRERLWLGSKKFGLSDPDVLALSRRIMEFVARKIERTTINGSRAKVGFSSPAYLAAGTITPATPDGRRNGEPFATHISPVSKEIDFAEIIDFAGQLDYSGNKINGNVVDFILSDQFVRHREKFVQILRVAFQKGVYELQLNVLNVDQLIAAKADPSLYPHLVVRVWGFSAYFNDLPDAYKDMLIERAMNSAA
ncbi:MAG: pyruvate formate lyase [Rikenella sp.]|nr:pyruvate formate lyase [Rikenella sp.]